MALQNTSFEQIGSGNSNTLQIKNQSTVTANTATTYTFVIADFIAGLMTTSNGSAQTLTLPTAAVVEAALPNFPVNASFEFSVAAIGAGTATVTTATGWTLIGSMAVATNIAMRFRAVKTALNAFTLYQMS